MPRAGAFRFFVSVHGLDTGMRLPCNLPAPNLGGSHSSVSLVAPQLFQFPCGMEGPQKSPCGGEGEEGAELRVAHCDQGR